MSKVLSFALSATKMSLPTAPFDWQETDVFLLLESWRSTMELLAKNTPIKSEEYRYCLQKGKEVMILKMLELNFSTTYVKLSDYSETYLLKWKDVPHFMTKFLQQLETVFTGNNEIKIRNKILAPAVGVATSTENVLVPEATEDWNRDDIQTLYYECQSAMKLLENNPAIKSEKYKQCLQKGRNIIIDTMMKFIMDAESLSKHSLSSPFIFDRKSSPKVLAAFIHHLETVFTGGKELQLGRKAKVFPPRPSLVALVEAPERRKKCEILRAYVELKSSANDIFLLKIFQGKISLNEKRAEEGETYELREEAKAMLCMHLWSLMKYVGFSKCEKIWESISRGWPECLSWEKGRDGNFWKIIRSDQLESWVADAYKDMEKYFKEDTKHSSCDTL